VCFYPQKSTKNWCSYLKMKEKTFLSKFCFQKNAFLTSICCRKFHIFSKKWSFPTSKLSISNLRHAWNLKSMSKDVFMSQRLNESFFFQFWCKNLFLRNKKNNFLLFFAQLFQNHKRSNLKMHTKKSLKFSTNSFPHHVKANILRFCIPKYCEAACHCSLTC